MRNAVKIDADLGSQFLPSAIVCNIGARENYALARTLHRSKLLAELITDVWVPSESVLRFMPTRIGDRLRGRHHVELKNAKVTHFTYAMLSRDARKMAFRAKPGWDDIIRHNNWFQAKTVDHLKSSAAFDQNGRKPVIIAYSYAARDILSHARKARVKTILSQIDGGEADEALIERLWLAQGSVETRHRAPPAYWKAWRDECELADHIIVNSAWSKNLLIEGGVCAEKLVVVPVIYERSDDRVSEPRIYPSEFSAARPLRVLFMGALTRRKGVLETLEAARRLGGMPVHFVFVGSDSEGLASQIDVCANVDRFDRVPRNRVIDYYKKADVFLFPTHSDGFGMTQIEALESGLPVIASRNCATLVQDQINGMIINEVSPTEIVRVVMNCLDRPAHLSALSEAAVVTGREFADASSGAFLSAFREFFSEESF
jgi:glycosyltransferase involved in cell wall biosynthesis